MRAFTWSGFAVRAIFALILVFVTFNPSGYSYFHWLKSVFPGIDPYVALCGLVLMIGWAIYLRATVRSLGPLGIVLAALLLGCIVWVFIDLGWFDWKNMNATAWVGLVIVSMVLAVGISWSHIRRRLSGQVDTDDVDEP